MCQDQVMKLPPKAIVLAGSKDCPNAMLQIGDRMMSIQAHPEFTKKYDKILMKTRVVRIGKEKVAKGIASLSEEMDIPLFREWVDNFIKK